LRFKIDIFYSLFETTNQNDPVSITMEPIVSIAYIMIVNLAINPSICDLMMLEIFGRRLITILKILF